MLFIFSISLSSFAKKVNTKELVAIVFQNFENGKYEKVISTLSKLKKRVRSRTTRGKDLQGLIYYWSGMAYTRLTEYDKAEVSFKKAIKLKYKSKDLFYEYGQVLYVQDKYKKARIAFKKSVQAGYKKAVSLYYIGFISQELKDFKKAVSFYNMIERLDDDEKDEIIQAARMQVGDIYLKRVERLPDTFKSVEKYVIPQYKKALSWNKNSKLASDIQKKIEILQRKYELILFKMRNGRSTSRPPYYMKASVLYGLNDNVNALDEDSKKLLTSDEDYSSSYTTTNFFGRYSIYPNSSFSYAPELSGSYTSYNSDSKEIIVNDNYFWKTALKSNYEHIYNEAPATFYIDFDYTYNADDSDADETMAFSSTVIGVTFSEELQLWRNNPTTVRYGYTRKTADVVTASTTGHSFTFEQVMLLKKTTLFSYNNFATTRYTETDSKSLNTNALTLRLDAIFPTLWGLFNPTVYGSYLSTNYVEDSDKAVTSLITYGLNMNRPLWSKLYLTVDLSLGTQTGKLDTDSYTQQVMTFNIDYIY
jgi:tetratricopeptide (TPR) repeat protein